jgi:hypothetical protein
MIRLLAVAALAEVATGASLMVAPSTVSRLLLGVGVDGVGAAVARVSGIAIISLGVACWPAKSASPAAIGGMVLYGALVGSYLAFLGLHDKLAGPLLWPAVALHALLSIMLTHAWATLGRSTRMDTIKGTSP